MDPVTAQHARRADPASNGEVEEPELQPTGHPDIEREGAAPATKESEGKRLLGKVADERYIPSDDEQAASLEFMLDAFHERQPVEAYQERLYVNVGTPRKPKKILWVIQALERHTIRRIEESVTSSRGVQQGRGATPEVRFLTSVRIVVEGTLIPDLKAGAAQTGIISPHDFLEESLKYKSGLIEQIAGEIYGLSGFDQADLSDATEIQAAGNS
jgi:hypothetical protein